MIELELTGIAHGGEALGRVEGRVHFVEGALPGERVRGDITKDGRAWARLDLREVLRPSPDRVAPPCPYFGACGGCQWQFAAYSAQLEWKREIVRGQLAHLGGLAEPPVRPTVVAGPPFRYRNRVDLQVVDGRPALLRRRSHAVVPVEDCLLIHPALAGLLARLGDLGEAKGVTLRVATVPEQCLTVVAGPVPAGAHEWGCGVAQRRGRRLVPVIGPGSIIEVVHEVGFRITGDAFFQNNTPGAAILAGLVAEALAPRRDETLLDAYAGGGLFALTVGRAAGRVIAVEASAVAAGDLRHNAAAAGMPVQVVEGTVEGALSHLGAHWEVAVVDPPRAGLGAQGVPAVVMGRPRALAYVSCDPASLARDARLLADGGYRLEWAAPVDLFPQAFHVETVAAFRRED